MGVALDNWTQRADHTARKLRAFDPRMGLPFIIFGEVVRVVGVVSGQQFNDLAAENDH